MKRFFIVIAISIVSQVAVAQWKFTVTVSKSGNCSGLDGAVSVRVAESMAKHYNEKTYSSSQDCEASRAIANGVVSDDGCKVRLVATPCSGPGGARGGVDVLGVGKGTSFYSVNGVNEINDWSNDDMERMLALNPEYKPKEPNAIATGDIAFDNFIENMPYSDEAFSGRMPRGSTGLVQSNGNIARSSGQPEKRGIFIPDDFTNGPFDYEQDDRRSDDLSFIKIDLPPVGPHTGKGVRDDGGVVSKALSAIDTKLNWYEAEDGNLLQYLYTKGKENVIDVGYWWKNSEISSNFSSTLQTVANIIQSDAISASVKKIIPSEGEDAYDIFDTVGGSLKELIKEGLNPKVITDKAIKGETMDMSPHIMKFNDEINGLAGRIAESHGMPNISLKNFFDQPKEHLEHQSVRALDSFNNISD